MRDHLCFHKIREWSGEKGDLSIEGFAGLGNGAQRDGQRCR